ncbi:cytidine deaminase [Paremcibacter congregatus]|uniref:Cytidine deaminase n=1 Tax=Paremcibacter congregatus TaxID=2043170 RepID=A0A2G4YTB8_9PROT|nr:cytidine deaminase [Paremcibacter congregatus]PHZ85543.1 cytidine deaminase [Paremcibacter congregatus]QDE26503.1 cytidine deaminase [Paremcibacter congregatus]
MSKDELIKAARAAKAHSYSPYSKFPVGAAVLLEDGQVFSGTNIENASYGLTCCAERVALFSARTASNSKVTGLAISIGRDEDQLAKESLVPCGACRQVMSEFMSPDTPVHVDGNRSFTLAELLPHSFVLPE